MQEKRFRFSEMLSALDPVMEASDLVRLIGASREGSIKAAITYASRRLGWRPSRTKHIWYKNARRIDAQEIDQLRALANCVAKERAIQAVVELRRSLAASGPGMDREAAAALDDALRLLGEPLRAVDVSEREGKG